jgi:phosphoribosylanthranilate isomerase
MTEVKICGITNGEDALTSVSAGADAIGFIFYAGSARCVTPDRVREITRKLTGKVCRVGVFVDQEPEEVRRVVRFCGLDLIQLHGKESPDYCGLFSPSVLIKAVALRAEGDLDSLSQYPVKAVLVDASDPVQPGGTGKTCDWSLARRAGERHRIILAGGLNAENILSALEAVSPLAVDVGSGVEERPGKKDPQKVKELAAIVKGTGMFSRSSPAASIFEKEGPDETDP